MPTNLSFLVFHEFTHSFVNPLVDRWAAELRDAEDLFGPVQEFMVQQSYPDWITTLKEHLVRARDIRIVGRMSGAEAQEEARTVEVRRGFLLVPPLMQILEDYEGNRTSYPSFADFFPELVVALRAMAAEGLPERFAVLAFDGTINSLRTHRRVAFILPTNEEPGWESEWMLSVLGDLFTRRSPDALLLTDEEALETDLSDRTLLVFGTPEGNAFLQAQGERLPFWLTADGLTLEGRITGTDLRLAIALRHPSSPTLGMLVYTAQSSLGVLGATNLPGSSGYVVAEGDRIVRRGWVSEPTFQGLRLGISAMEPGWRW